MANFEQLQNYVTQRKAKRQEKFDADFWETKIRKIQGNSGTFDVDNKLITGSNAFIPDATSAWNEYLTAVKSRGLKPNYEQFLNQYNNLKSVSAAAFLDNLQSAQASGMSMKDIRKAIKKSPDLIAEIKEHIKNNPDPEVKNVFGAYLPARKKTFMEGISSPLAAGAGVAAALGGPAAYRYGMGKISDLRGSDILKTQADDLTGKYIDDKDLSKKINKARYKEYEKDAKAKLKKNPKYKSGKLKGKNRPGPLSFDDWSKKKPNAAPKMWTEKTIAEANKLLGKDKAKKLNLYTPKKTPWQVTKGLVGKGGIRGAIGLGTAALINQLTAEE